MTGGLVPEELRPVGAALAEALVQLLDSPELALETVTRAQQDLTRFVQEQRSAGQNKAGKNGPQRIALQG
jgi:hypothetical protein